MTLHAHPDLEQRSDEWRDVRRGMVTASVVGQLVSSRTLGAIEFGCPACTAPIQEPCRSLRGGAPIKTLHPERAAVAAEANVRVIEPASSPESRALTALLAAERITGWTEETPISAAMWRGIDDEPRAVEKYSERHAPVTLAGFMVRDDWGFQIGYSPDGLVGDDGLIEVKSRAPKKHLQTILADAVPAENMAQIQCGLLVSGREWCDYISYCGGMPMWVKCVKPDPMWQDAIVAAVMEFEKAVALMTATYTKAVEGLHTTERIVFEDMVI